jgi:prepilin-type N-terminal cleavage/methylation domain-containing protein
MNTCRQSGFTLWELLMTLLVAGILFGIGVPNVMEFQRNSVMTATANDFVTAVLAARTEAVKRQVPVTLCLVDDPAAVTPTCEPDAVADSTRGFIVWVDENGNVDADGIPILTDGTDGNALIDGGEVVLRRGTVLPGAVRVSTNCGHVSFGPTGVPRQVPGECFPFNAGWAAFLFCDDRGQRIAAGSLSSARFVRVDRFGRGQVQSELAGDNGIGIANTITGTLTPAGIAPTCP